MSGIAEVLLNLGYIVSGSDLRETDITKRLVNLGGRVFLGHDSEWIMDADVVVTSTAVHSDNPEVVAARNAHIPVIPRAAMLAELMRLKKYGIAIAGSHGKTTTTSLVGWVMARAGLDPTVIIGGKVNSLGSNAKLGQGEFLVAEADESDGSFLQLSPVLEVVTNIDFEHVDYYADFEEVKKTFLEFINKIPFYGAAILCLEDPGVLELLPEIRKRVITYGMTSQADVYARGISMDGLVSRFEVMRHGESLGQVVLALPGVHNVLNALAAVTIGFELDISFKVIAEALASFTGVQRRLQIKGEVKGITVMDDYGHHPTEIRATLGALRGVWPRRRLLVLFQPHRYSRTQGLIKEFCMAFHDADLLFLTNIYSAGEIPIEGVTGEALVEGVRQHGHRNVTYIAEVKDLPAVILPILREGDVVLTLGAGNILQAGEQLLKQLEELPHAG